MAKRYRARVGLDYNGRRFEPGDELKQLPAKSAPWLLEQGLIEVIAPKGASSPSSSSSAADDEQEG